MLLILELRWRWINNKPISLKKSRNSKIPSRWYLLLNSTLYKTESVLLDLFSSKTEDQGFKNECCKCIAIKCKRTLGQNTAHYHAALRNRRVITCHRGYMYIVSFHSSAVFVQLYRWVQNEAPAGGSTVSRTQPWSDLTPLKILWVYLQGSFLLSITFSLNEVKMVTMWISY